MRPNAAWIEQVHEAALEPDLVICDPHHHLWDRPGDRYLVEELHADTAAGHRVVTTVYSECGFGYRTDGPEELKPVGETEFVASQAALSAATERAAPCGGAVIAGIVGYADLRLGPRVTGVLEAHVAAGDGLFRGIRHTTNWDADPAIRTSHVGSPPGLMGTTVFTDGLKALATMGLSFDSWLYHPQLGELTAAARAVPDVVIILDHLGGPLGIGPYQDRAAVSQHWRSAVEELATCQNVFLKIGGIAMPDFGIPWDQRALPPTSLELAERWNDDIHFVVDAFGPDRCMFESNFPVDGRTCSYVVLWNAFKRIAAGYAPEEKRSLFHDTAAHAYRLSSPA